MPPKEKKSMRPALGLEKELVKDEISTALHAGVEKLEGKAAPKQRVDNFHNTKFLLKQYRRVAYSVFISESELNLRMEMEHGTRLSTLEVNAELAGIDLSNTKLENHTKSVIRSKTMLDIINTALEAVRQDPDRGELMYRESFNPEAPDLPGMLYEAWKASENLIDSANQQPFYALVSYAKEEPETVRKMFRELFADDGGNLAERQEKIIAFIQSSEELKAKYAPGSWRYTNDQRSVMAYLFFHDPEHNYLYKATQAHEFADCVEFLDDWGAGANFTLDVYYRMCDELVAAIKDSPALLQTHMKPIRGKC